LWFPERNVRLLIPGTCKGDLIWKRVFAVGIKFKMRSSQISWAGPNAMTGILSGKKKKRWRQRRATGKTTGGWRQRRESQPQAKERQGLPAATRSEEREWIQLQSLY
jgi:hypothetical protein